MSIQTKPGTTAYTYSTGIKPSAQPSLAWLRGALVLAIGAQLITISALASADPLTVSWAALLLGIAPAPLAALPVLAALPWLAPKQLAPKQLAPKQYVRPAVILDGVVLVVGIIGGVTHTGLFFLPELAVLVFGAVQLFRE
jgi:hypothetical protein